MNLFLPDPLLVLLSQTAALLVMVVPGLLAYGYLMDGAVFEDRGKVASARFGGVDAVIAALIVLFFLFLVVLNVAAPARAAVPEAQLPDAGHVIGGILQSEVIFLTMVGGFLAAMKMRGNSLRAAFGVNRVGGFTVIGSALLLLILALPVIQSALLLSRVLLAGLGYLDASPQDMVRLLSENRSVTVRVALAISAAVLAPIQEELIFRGFLYGVFRRYVGPAAGMVVSAALFAAIHMHLPSFAGLFVLAVCLTLAYEWTGSILVPMAMHAMFNSITLISLFFGGSAGN